MNPISNCKAIAAALFVFCMAGGYAWSQPAADASQGVALTANLGPHKTGGAKDLNVGGMMSISGNINAQISMPTATVSMSAARIRNESTTNTSGALRLRVFVTPVPLNDALSYYTIGETALNPLPPQGEYDNFSATSPLSVPPDGVYYLNLGIFEQEAGCTTGGGFCLDYGGTFTSQVQVIGGAFFSYTPIRNDHGSRVLPRRVQPLFHHRRSERNLQLDAGVFTGWARTGRSFGIWKAAADGLSPVCRFFSASFAPLSSHFYTPFSTECAIVKTNNDWQFEASPPISPCPTPTARARWGYPLYRLYNNGMGGSTQSSLHDEPRRAYADDAVGNPFRKGRYRRDRLRAVLTDRRWRRQHRLAVLRYSPRCWCWCR